MDDIRLSSGLPGHPKTLKLERRLGAAGCWALVKLLCWVGDNRPDGDLTGLTDEDLELSVRWLGPTPLVPALREVGFLDGEVGKLRIHDWQFHQPYVSSRPERVEKAKAAARARWDKATPEERQATGRQMSHARRTRHKHARCVEQEDADQSERASGKSADVPETCSEHVGNVPSTHTPTPAPTQSHAGRTERDMSPENGDTPPKNGGPGAHPSDVPQPGIENWEILERLGPRELKGLQTTLQRTLRDRRMPEHFRESMRVRLNQIMALQRGRG